MISDDLELALHRAEQFALIALDAVRQQWSENYAETIPPRLLREKRNAEASRVSFLLGELVEALGNAKDAAK